MTLLDLMKVSAKSFVFVRTDDEKVHEVLWGRVNGAGAAIVDHANWSEREVREVFATKYPMYDSVLEVRVV